MVKNDGKQIKNFKEKNLITYYITNNYKKILFTSWKKFKGLDRKNVVLIDFEPDNFFIEGNNNFFSHFYVGVTRARDNCYILAPDYIKSEAELVADSIYGFYSSDSIRHRAQEHSVRDSLNRDFLKKFHIGMLESYRNAICKALNAENMYSENGGESE